MVLPKASVIIAGHLQPIPVPNEIYTQRSSAETQVIQEFQPRYAELEAQFNIKRVAVNPIAYRIEGDYQGYQAALPKINEERDRKIEENNAKIDRDYQLRKNAQASLAKNISRISPASAVTFGATTLARTGVDDYNRFVKAALEYKPVVTEWVRTSPDIRVTRTVTLANGNTQTVTNYKEVESGMPAGMPQPAIESENLSLSINRILPDLTSMAVMIVLLMGGAYFAFIRCDVR